MKVSKQTLLTDLSFGRRVAEEEAEDLASYFVETEQWRKVISGEIDVVFGAKGAGKSAIYSTLLQRDGELFDRGILLISAENPRGTPAFKDLVSDPPTTEAEFVGLWKLYALSLISSVLDEYGVQGSAARSVKTALVNEGLVPTKDAPLRTRVRLILDFVRRALTPRTVETELKFDPQTGVPTGVGGKITLGEPSSAAKSKGAVSVDYLLQLADQSLAENGLEVWLLFDRLDVAFAESRELESNGLRALFKCYLDLLSASSIKLKIFLRSDIWASITAGGFREASHITRALTIAWSNPSLLNLVVNRLLRNVDVIRYYGEDPRNVSSSAQKRELFDRIVPDKVDAGKNPKSFEWILGRVQDGTGTVAPREVIHLLTEARDAQLVMLERGEDDPPGTELLSRQALREALAPVSRVRLEQTIYAEYPELKERILALEQEKTEHTLDTLAQIWTITTEETRLIAARLVEVGFFEPRGNKSDPRFWVPFLYRPALNMVQGSASTD
ncbi:MAG: hypothetical protein M3O70_07675 [Actinomycetota bacterium]|nr:hypothetical protein [Actinomycetota bacterium]